MPRKTWPAACSQFGDAWGLAEIRQSRCLRGPEITTGSKLSGYGGETRTAAGILTAVEEGAWGG